MKKNLFSTLAFASLAGSMFAQLPVNTAPENKKVVLEEFTGIYCGYCPDGHQTANSIHDADPTNVVLINIHSGGYAAVAAGEPDLTTPVGTAIDGMPGMGITGYPAGDINRKVFTGGIMSGGRNLWSSWANSIKTQPAYCNVALQGTIDATTRVLTVEAQVYYTANSPAATNYLNIVMLEDSVMGPQHNYGSPTPYNYANYNADGSYNHNHVLRKALTPNFGLAIPVTSTGSTFTTTATYTIPLTYGAAGKTNPCMLGQLRLAAFVTESNVNTINANHGPITLVNIPNNVDAAPSILKTDASVCLGTNFATSFKFQNLGNTPITSADFDYAVNGNVIGTYNWVGTVSRQYISQQIDIPPFNFPTVTTNTNILSITVTNVNGSNSDQNASNNSSAKPIARAPVAHGSLFVFNFTQDFFGNESSWSIADEATGTPVIDVPAGTYSMLGNANNPQNITLLHSDTLVLNPGTCYRLTVGDVYGDGINSAGSGAGGYLLKSNNIAVFSSNGQYGKGETRLFKTADTLQDMQYTSIATVANNIKEVNLYPNPASNVTNLSVTLSQNENIGVTVLNSIGQEVYTSKNNSFAAGVNTIALNTDAWASGVYFINVSTLNGSAKRKLTVVH